MTDRDQLEAEAASMTDREVIDQFDRLDWPDKARRVVAEDIADRLASHVRGERSIKPTLSDLLLDTSEEALFEMYAGALPREMERKLEIGKERYGNDWVDSDPAYMIRRVEEEFHEFRQAVEHYRDEDAALEELADMVNFAVMCMALSFAEDGDGSDG